MTIEYVVLGGDVDRHGGDADLAAPSALQAAEAQVEQKELVASAGCENAAPRRGQFDAAAAGRQAPPQAVELVDGRSGPIAVAFGIVRWCWASSAYSAEVGYRL